VHPHVLALDGVYARKDRKDLATALIFHTQ
jgi:hypothetical protein